MIFIIRYVLGVYKAFFHPLRYFVTFIKKIHIPFPHRSYYPHEKIFQPTGFFTTLRTGAETHTGRSFPADSLFLSWKFFGISLGNPHLSCKGRYLSQPWIFLWSMAPCLWYRRGDILLPFSSFRKKCSRQNQSQIHPVFSLENKIPPNHYIHQNCSSWNSLRTCDRMASQYIFPFTVLGLQQLSVQFSWIYLPFFSNRIWYRRYALDLCIF